MQVNLKNVSQIFPLDTGHKVAVNNVSLEIVDGERIGIIGSNGAGKTTLLQLIAGLATPTNGLVNVQGHVSCIMTLGVGLREELSGRENVFIDGEVNGLSKEEIELVVDDVLNFAELGDFAERPVRTYSTGMKARLAFSMITYIEPGVLIIDEALSAGDSQFGVKASAKMKEICQKGKILLLVSHSMKAINDMCDRCIWMEDGCIVEDGSPSVVTEKYLEAMRKVQEEKMLADFEKLIGGNVYQEGYFIETVQFMDSNDTPRNIFLSDQSMEIKISISTKQQLETPDIRITFERLDANIMLRNTASGDGLKLNSIKGKTMIQVDLGEIMLGQNTYQVHVELLDSPDGDNILASYTSILKVEKPTHVKDDPAYFADANVVVERIGGVH